MLNEKIINFIQICIWPLCIILCIIGVYNLIIYDVQDVIQTYEDQIKIAQDNSIVHDISGASFETTQNEMTGENRLTIKTLNSVSLTGVYNEQGEIISIDYSVVSITALAIIFGILIGGLVGMLLAACLSWVIDKFEKTINKKGE